MEIPRRFVYVIHTCDLQRSIAFYRDALGFELLEEWSELGRGAVFSAGPQAQIELIESDAPATTASVTALGLEVPDVDERYERLVAAGEPVKAPPRLREWGARGFGTTDPNGVPINIYWYPDAND